MYFQKTARNLETWNKIPKTSSNPVNCLSYNNVYINKLDLAKSKVANDIHKFHPKPFHTQYLKLLVNEQLINFITKLV